MAEALVEQPCIEVSNSIDRPLHHDLEEAGTDDTPDCSLSSPGCKRLRCSEAIPPSPATKRYKSLGLQLYVRMDTVSGRSRMHNMSLRRVQDVHCLEGLPKDLVRKAFPNAAPARLSSSEFYHFTPQDECLSLPTDVLSTCFKLVASYDGWEYTVYERTLRAADDQPRAEAADRPMLVTIVDFESTAMVIGHLGIRIRLVAYPLVSIRKTFLDEIDYNIRNDPQFKGIL